MKIKILYLIFRDVPLQLRDIPKVRGYLAAKHPEISELHNHLPNNKFDYRYPVIQYRAIDGFAAILALGRGIDIIMNIILNVDNIKISTDCYSTNDKEIVIREEEIGITGEYYSYRFLSPWIALSEKNYPSYKQAALHTEKQLFLRHILRENLKTLSKGCEYTIENIDELQVDGHFTQSMVRFKNRSLFCFQGFFRVNFLIPEYFGLGKWIAKGFGVVIRDNN